MKTLMLTPVLVLVTLFADLQALDPASGTPCSGTFTQTAITSLTVFQANGVTILEQTSVGTVDGTLTGTYEDALRVIIRPNGTFSAAFTLTVDGSLGGQDGELVLQCADVGQIVGPTTAAFSGVAAVTGTSGGLAGLQGVLDIAGTVDLVTGLSTYSYEGVL